MSTTSRVRRRGPVVLLALCALVVTGCAGQPDGDEQSVESTGGTRAGVDVGRALADWRQLGGRGFVYLQANTDGAKHYEVLRADLDTGEVEQITDVPGPLGISQFSVSSAGLVVAEASTLVDRLATVERDGRLALLPGAGAAGPVINRRGDVVAYRPTDDGEDLVLLRSGADRWELLADFTRWTVSTWLDDTTVAVFEPRRDRSTWSRLQVDGRRGRPVDLGPGELYPSDYGTHGPSWTVLQAGGERPAQLWMPGREPIALPAGWQQGCVSPDRRRALLVGAAGLAVVRIDDKPRARVIGEPDVEILGCGWVDEKYGP